MTFTCAWRMSSWCCAVAEDFLQTTGGYCVGVEALDCTARPAWLGFLSTPALTGSGIGQHSLTSECACRELLWCCQLLQKSWPWQRPLAAAHSLQSTSGCRQRVQQSSALQQVRLRWGMADCMHSPGLHSIFGCGKALSV